LRKKKYSNDLILGKRNYGNANIISLIEMDEIMTGCHLRKYLKNPCGKDNPSFVE
jgi:hypothetical protein